jgi:hypothetical protein
MPFFKKPDTTETPPAKRGRGTTPLPALLTITYEAIRRSPRKRVISPDGASSSSPLQQPIIMLSTGESQDPDRDRRGAQSKQSPAEGKRVRITRNPPRVEPRNNPSLHPRDRCPPPVARRTTASCTGAYTHNALIHTAHQCHPDPLHPRNGIPKRIPAPKIPSSLGHRGQQ